IRGVGHACEALRQDLIFHITNGTNPLNSNNVGGIIFADIIENRKQVEAAMAAGTPCMIINNHADDLDVSYIAVDNKAGGQTAADYLTSLGHKRIATVTGNLSTQAGLERFEGFKKHLDKKNIDLPDEYVFKGDYSRRCARNAIEQFLALSNPPTAIFAASDEMALEVIATLLEKGKKVPEDMSIVGFDDNPSCLYGPVGLTTIRQPLFEMAEESVKTLNAIVNEKLEGSQKKILEPDLVIRESCASLSR
ncbi:MAG: substrate-binding domain-containing protein, partial [Candidatus Omnitrophica bacterium]|nr:substrate-binding domain-containing protein [Candidatus Omnitrophota bacterium]